MSDTNGSTSTPDEVLILAADIVTAYVSNNNVDREQLPSVIQTVHNALKGLNQSTVSEEAEQKPAVPIKKSFTTDYIVCLEDGKKLKMLKRYLRSRYGMTPDEYRSKWNLPADYPMVAPAYAKRRSEFAKKIGLGKKRG